MRNHASGFRGTGTALLRAVPTGELELPPWPDLTSLGPEHVACQVEWLRQVWKIDHVAEAIGHATPVLAAQVDGLLGAQDPAAADARRAVLSVARYLQRMAGRPTPFGLLAGVASAVFAQRLHLRWGSGHRPVARADAGWLAEVIARLEGCPGLLARLPVVGNSTLMVRGDRLIVPYQPQPRHRETVAVEVSLRHTAAVRAAVEAAHAPILLGELAAELHAAFPSAAPAAVTAMLAELVTRRALITSLHAPSTEPDALGHLVQALDAAKASQVMPVRELVDELRQIHALLETHNQAPAAQARPLCSEAAARMRGLADIERHPVAVDLRLDASLVLPDQVAREAERAALALTRLSAYPYGTPTWRAYHQRFYERFGIGSLVPVLDVVADSGIGWPDGYPGTVTEAPRSPISRRDERLLALAQQAALEGRDEVVVDDTLLTALELGPQPPRTPSHLEVCVRIHATSQEALQQGDFRLEITSVSRAAGTLTGRFLSILSPCNRAAQTAALVALPASDGDTMAVQLSFPPLNPASGHVARAVPVLPVVVSLGEHRATDDRALTVKDLAVGCDGRRMYLTAPALGRRVEAIGMHALNLRTHTPPLARFLSEISRAQNAQVTQFDWGAAARLPFLPRLRYGRTILAAARWRLEAAELPGRAEPWSMWDQAFSSWRARRHLPHLVHLAEGDRRLLLDLDVVAHRVLLRIHLNTTPHAVLIEAPGPDAYGWCGGRPHEVIVPLTAIAPPRWPRLPKPTTPRIISRGQGQPPAISNVLLASLYGDLHRQNVILADHLPVLLDRLGQPAWWYVRYRDPDQHLRLRIALPDPDEFGPVARTVSTWASELHRHGLLRELVYPTSYPETGRWGSGPAWAAAQRVFGADSQALLVQLGQRQRPDRQALVAAHSVAIAQAFAGSTDAGMRWLIDHIPAAAPARIPRPVFTEAVRIANPAGGWAALRDAPGGAAIVTAWTPRDCALAEYRTHFPSPDTQGVAVDDVLGSLLHVNYVRAVAIDFPDEAECLYLARAAALAWTARSSGGHR